MQLLYFKPRHKPRLHGLMSQFVIRTAHLLCSGFDYEDGRQSAPLTETLTLHCTSTRHATSRYAGEAVTRKPPQTENEREVLIRRACARTLNPRSLLLLEHSTQPTPSPHYGLASWPLAVARVASFLSVHGALLAERKGIVASTSDRNHSPGGKPARNEAAVRGRHGSSASGMSCT